MTIICKIAGHVWEGCKCIRCGALQDNFHLWRGCNCTKCGVTRHDWQGCICRRCRFVDRQRIVNAIYQKLAAKRVAHEEIGFVLGEEHIRRADELVQTHGDFEVVYHPPEGEIGRGADVADLGGMPWLVDPNKPVYWGTPPSMDVVPPIRESNGA